MNPYLRLHPSYGAAKRSGMSDSDFVKHLNDEDDACFKRTLNAKKEKVDTWNTASYASIEKDQLDKDYAAAMVRVEALKVALDERGLREEFSDPEKYAIGLDEVRAKAVEARVNLAKTVAELEGMTTLVRFASGCNRPEAPKLTNISSGHSPYDLYVRTALAASLGALVAVTIAYLMK